MKAGNDIPTTIDEYIGDFPEEIRQLLEQVRHTIRKAAPDAQEKISYQIPAFTLKGALVYFAAFKHHIGFYPASSGIEVFQNELSIYKKGKGSVQFPLDKPLPLDLIKRMVQFRVAENLEKAAFKSLKKTKP